MSEELREELKQKGLRVTPQRVVIYEAVVNLKNHPTAENIIDYIKKNQTRFSAISFNKNVSRSIESPLVSLLAITSSLCAIAV